MPPSLVCALPLVGPLPHSGLKDDPAVSRSLLRLFDDQHPEWHWDQSSPCQGHRGPLQGTPRSICQRSGWGGKAWAPAHGTGGGCTFQSHRPGFFIPTKDKRQHSFSLSPPPISRNGSRKQGN